MIAETGKRNIYRISILLYAVLNFVLLTHHEAWRDEAQAWTIARNLNIGEIIDLLPTEGHLLPFFVILKAWYKLGGTYAWIGLISLSIMTVTVAVLLYMAPFPVWVKLLLVVSPIFFYYNAVIVRCYALVVLALVLVAVTRKKMQNRMLAYCLSVAFLMQTHILVIPLAAALCVELLIYCIIRQPSKKNAAMATIPLLSLITAFFELYQKRNTAFITFDTILGNFKTAGMEPILNRLKTIITKVYAEGCIYNIVILLLVLTFVVFIIFAVINIVEKNIIIKTEIIVCTIGLLGYLAIVGFVRECAHIQMALVFYMLIMFTAWVLTDAQQAETTPTKEQNASLRAKYDHFIRTTLTVVLVLLTILSYRKESVEIKYDFYNNYSNSRIFATKAIDYLPSESIILIRQEDYKISAPYAYITDKREDVVFWDVDEDREFKCIIWGEDYPHKDTLIAASRFKGNVYMLASTKLEELGKAVISVEEPNVWSENYYLYNCNDIESNHI